MAVLYTTARSYTVNLRLVNATFAASLVAAAAAAPAMAAPTLYPRPGNRLSEVHNNTTSTVVSDTGASDQLWVLPPKTGTVGVTGLSLNANAGFCAEMSDLQFASRTLAKKISEVFIDLEQFDAELQDLRQQKAALDLQAEGLFEDHFVQEIDDVSDEIFETEGRIDDLRITIEDCTTNECEDDIREELDTLKTRKRELQDELSTLRRDHRDEYRDYTRLKNQVDAIDRAIDAVFELAAKKSGFLIEGKTQIFNMYKQYAQLEGGFSNIAFDSHWQNNTIRVRNDNPGFTVSEIETHDVRMNVALIAGLGEDGYLDQLPAVLGYSVNGAVFTPSDPQQFLPALPDQVQGNARLSLIGACPAAHPDLFDLPKDAAGVPLFGLSATYTYPTAFRTHVKATYNLWKIYEHMKKVTEDGGLFSSSTKVEENTNTAGDSSMTFEFFDESGMPQWQQDEIKRQITMELMQDVLRLMGVPPPPTGAVVLANGIEDTCGWYSFYCGGASWILRGLNAIFGDSTSESTFRTSSDFTATREYNTDAVYQRPGMVSYGNAP
jgi:hypothetical protein